jgi:hypothetical protein
VGRHPDGRLTLTGGHDEPSMSRNKHGLTPLGCAVGGTQGLWKPLSNATVEEWQRAAELIRARGGTE